VIGLGSLRPERTPGTSSQAVCTHDSCDTILRAGDSESAKFTSHSRTAVAPGVAVRVNDSDLVKELLIGTVAFTRFTFAELVISGARDAKGLAKFSDKEVLPHRINQRIPPCGSSESMLIAFFRISRWRRRYSTSR